MHFICLRKFPSVSSLLTVFIMKRFYFFTLAHLILSQPMKGFWIFVKCFFWSRSCDLKKILLIAFALINFWMLNQLCIPGISPTWSWYIILLKCCWIQFANMLLKTLVSIFITYVGL